VKIATWNVNSLTARWPRVSAWLAETQTDVVLIQETKQTDAKFPFAELAALGYESAHYGQGQWNGVAIFSRVGLDNVVTGLGSDEEARCIRATCGGVRVYSCYVPNGRSLDNPHYTYKLGWLGDLRDELAQRDPQQPIVVGGDFNVALEDVDVYDVSAFDGATHVSAPEREAIRGILDTGLVDLARQQQPEGAAYTWWDYRNGAFRRGWGLRIDYLFSDVATAARATEVAVDRAARKGEKPSDHAPVVVTLSE
jgi:exodeoxyribonuclease-3